MPITTSAKKALRVSERKQVVNRKTRKQLKKAVTEFEKRQTPESLRVAVSEIDKAVKKNLIHKNKAARLKSKFSKKLKEFSKKSSTSSQKPKKTVAKKSGDKMAKK
jgi:small subunit ribosomal protein S20